MSYDLYKELKAQYAGRRAVLLPRGSTSRQEISVADQILAMRKFAQQIGLIIVGEMGAAGQSGLESWNRVDLNEVIDRKKNADDFDILVVYDIDRFSRAYLAKSFDELVEINSLGIEVLVSSRPIPNDERGQMEWAWGFIIAHGQVESLSRSICRGRQSSLTSRRMLPFPHTPFGTDRLISHLDGTPRHIIRICRDGSQVVLDAITKNIIDRYPAGRSKSGARYFKQKTDLVELIPGRPEDIEIVLRMFHMKFIEGLGNATIVRKLNESRILSPRGCDWGTGTVDSIFDQECYCGYVVGNQKSRAIMNRCSPDGPEKVVLDPKCRAGSKRPDLVIRDPKNWVHVDQPHMKEYLPLEIRGVAISHVDSRRFKRYENSKKPKWKKNKHQRDRHKNSPYLLKGILTEARTGMSMSGSGGTKNRYYRITRANTHPGSDLPDRKQVNARPIDDIVRESLHWVVSQWADSKAIIRDEIERQKKASALGNVEIDRLKTERLELDQNVKFFHQYRDTYGDEMVIEMVRENRLRADEIDTRIAEADRQDGIWGSDVERSIEELAKSLCNVSDWICQGPSEAVRRILRLLVVQATVDTSTREFQIEFQLPKRLYDCPSEFSLEADSLYQVGFQTKTDKVLLRKRLRYTWSGGRKGSYALIESLGKTDDQNDVIHVESDQSDQTAA